MRAQRQQSPVATQPVRQPRTWLDFYCERPCSRQGAHEPLHLETGSAVFAAGAWDADDGFQDKRWYAYWSSFDDASSEIHPTNSVNAMRKQSSSGRYAPAVMTATPPSFCTS